MGFMKRGLFYSFLALNVSAWQCQRYFKWGYPPPQALLETEVKKEDVSALLLGARRMGANLAFIQAMQYYGQQDTVENIRQQEAANSIVPSARDFTMRGVYPYLKTYTLRIMMLDPYFSRGIIEFIGSIAFNQQRSVEAMGLLRQAIAYNPTYYQYRIYLACLLYDWEKNDQKLIKLLEEVVDEQDCPVLLKNILGNLYMKHRQPKEAVRIYLKILADPRFEKEHQGVLEKLENLARSHEEWRVYIKPALKK